MIDLERRILFMLDLCDEWYLILSVDQRLVKSTHPCKNCLTWTVSLLRPDANDIIIRINNMSNYTHTIRNLRSGTAEISISPFIYSKERTYVLTPPPSCSAFSIASPTSLTTNVGYTLHASLPPPWAWPLPQGVAKHPWLSWKHRRRNAVILHYRFPLVAR